MFLFLQYNIEKKEDSDAEEDDEDDDDFGGGGGGAKKDLADDPVGRKFGFILFLWRNLKLLQGNTFFMLSNLVQDRFFKQILLLLFSNKENWRETLMFVQMQK